MFEVRESEGEEAHDLYVDAVDVLFNILVGARELGNFDPANDIVNLQDGVPVLLLVLASRGIVGGFNDIDLAEETNCVAGDFPCLVAIEQGVDDHDEVLADSEQFFNNFQAVIIEYNI